MYIYYDYLCIIYCLSLFHSYILLLFIQVHFALDMWQQRTDGKRKLNPNAVPTIFGFFLKKKMPIPESENNEVLLIKNTDVSDNILWTTMSLIMNLLTLK